MVGTFSVMDGTSQYFPVTSFQWVAAPESSKRSYLRLTTIRENSGLQGTLVMKCLKMLAIKKQR